MAPNQKCDNKGPLLHPTYPFIRLALLTLKIRVLMLNSHLIGELTTGQLQTMYWICKENKWRQWFDNLSKAHHSFDSKSSLEQNKDGLSFKDCLFKLMILECFNELLITTNVLTFYAEKIFFCVEKGVTMGGNPAAGKQLALDLGDFKKITTQFLL